MSKLKAILLTSVIAPVVMLGLLSGCAHHEERSAKRAEAAAVAQRRVRAVRAVVRAKRTARRATIVRQSAAAADESAPRALPLQRRVPETQRMTAPPPGVAPPPAPAAPPAPPATRAPALPSTPPAARPVAPPAAAPTTPEAQPPPPQPPADPLPTQPAPPPERPDPLPAPPNRANVTPPRQSGGGIIGARQATVPEASRNQQAPPSVVPEVPAAQRESTLAAYAPSGALQIDEARRLLAGGKVLEARATLESALSASPATALHELGRTFDPYYLGMLPSIDSGSEPRRAAALYREAIVHGSTSAGSDLDRLRMLLTPPR